MKNILGLMILISGSIAFAGDLAGEDAVKSQSYGNFTYTIITKSGETYAEARNKINVECVELNGSVDVISASEEVSEIMGASSETITSSLHTVTAECETR